MKKYNVGNCSFLERVCYLSRGPSKETDLFGDEITVKHTFPYNPASKTAPETAKRWADNTTYDHETRQYVKGPEPEFLERANDPFTITIIDLDVRSKGGRAYKVVDPDGRCFDLREDQVLEVFKHSGILAGGQVPGQFVWGILGSQMRMVLVGGDLHKEMVAQLEDLKDFKRKQASGQTPTEGTLKFGFIYRKRDQSLHVFLGRVKAPGNDKVLFAFARLPESPSAWDDVDLDDLDRFNGEHGNHMREERDTAKKWDTMTWAERCQWDWYDRNAYLHRQYKDHVEPGYYDHPADIVLMSSPKFKEELVEAATGVAIELRENAEAKHKYVNGKCYDLVTERWRMEHVDMDPPWELYNRDLEERRKARVAFLTRLKQFKAELVWV